MPPPPPPPRPPRVTMRPSHLNDTSGADKERGHMIDRILHLTLDILYLLTGEDYIVLRMSCGRVTHSSSPHISGGFGRTPTITPTPERNNEQKILEVTQKMMELLTGEAGRGSAREKISVSQSVKQEEDGDPRSGDGSSNRSTPVGGPRPLGSREVGLSNAEMKEGPRDPAALCIKKETTEQDSNAKKRGRPRKRRIMEAASSRPGPVDIFVITEDFQGEAKEVTTDDQQMEVTKDLLPGWSQDKRPSMSVIEEDEDDGERCGDEEDGRRRPSKGPAWEISEGGSPHRMASKGPGPSQDTSSEDTVVRVSLDDVQDEEEPGEAKKQRKRRTFTCLDSSGLLESHHKVHAGEAPFSCAACGSSFASSEELGKHFQAHTSEKPFACARIGKHFTVQANLIAHRRVHTGGKPCAECGRRFALRSSLEAHLPVHTLEKPYPCALCGGCFTDNGRLAVHRTTHAGEKSYGCEDCGKIFTTSSSKNRHRRTHTGEKPYSCMVCGKCFNRETNLYRHQMIHTR